MTELIIIILMGSLILFIYLQQATSKKYSKLKRSIQAKKEEEQEVKRLEKIRKEREKKEKRIIERAYRSATKVIKKNDNKIFLAVFNEFIDDYRKAEEIKERTYQQLNN